nr:uncharacterized protein LOC127316296 [Lolium perenne]
MSTSRSVTGTVEGRRIAETVRRHRCAIGEAERHCAAETKHRRRASDSRVWGDVTSVPPPWSKSNASRGHPRTSKRHHDNNLAPEGYEPRVGETTRGIAIRHVQSFRTVPPRRKRRRERRHRQIRRGQDRRFLSKLDTKRRDRLTSTTTAETTAEGWTRATGAGSGRRAERSNLDGQQAGPTPAGRSKAKSAGRDLPRVEQHQQGREQPPPTPPGARGVAQAGAGASSRRGKEAAASSRRGRRPAQHGGGRRRPRRGRPSSSTPARGDLHASTRMSTTPGQGHAAPKPRWSSSSPAGGEPRGKRPARRGCKGEAAPPPPTPCRLLPGGALRRRQREERRLVAAELFA